MKAKYSVYLHNRQSKQDVHPALRALLRKAIRTALEFEDFTRPAEVSLTLTDDATIHALNLQHRGIDRPTDVLSFPMLEEEADTGDFDGEAVLLGDIVISLERAALQAAEYGHSFEREVAFLAVHSVLHLLGYDHENGEAEEQEMFARQEAILTAMELSRSPASSQDPQA